MNSSFTRTRNTLTFTHSFLHPSVVTITFLCFSFTGLLLFFSFFSFFFFLFYLTVTVKRDHCGHLRQLYPNFSDENKVKTTQFHQGISFVKREKCIKKIALQSLVTKMYKGTMSSYKYTNKE